ncbi:MAG: DUF4405 domain-containing protein [Sporolactobacillus sp.]
MNKKTAFKMIISLLMTITLLILMTRQLTGDVAHEWFGVGIFVLFFIHQYLNWRWYPNLLKGKYSSFRTFQTIINFLVLLSIIGLMVSGIILSRYVFDFLSISGGREFARKLHMLAAFWGFALMSVHLGVHWNMIMGMIRKSAKVKPSVSRTLVLRTAAILIAGYGLYAFLKNNIASYMFSTTSYVFVDYTRSGVAVFAEYLAIMSLFVLLAYYVTKLFKSIGRRKRNAARRQK